MEGVRGVVVAGRWYFPAPSLALRVSALAFEVFRRRRAVPVSPCGDPDSCGPSGPWLPFRALTCCPGRTFVDLLSWDSSVLAPRPSQAKAVQMNDRSFRRGPRRAPHTPPPTPTQASGGCHRASTPTGVAACFGSRETISGVLFRPRGFAPPRRFPPLGGRGLVASRCRSWGSLRFGPPRPRARRPASRSAVGGGHGVLAAHFIPLEESSVAAAPRHRGRCPLAVGFRTGQTLRHPPLPANISEPHLYGASTSGRCSAAESGREPTVADRSRILSFLGFVPLRGPSAFTDEPLELSDQAPHAAKIRR